MLVMSVDMSALEGAVLRVFGDVGEDDMLIRLSPLTSPLTSSNPCFLWATAFSGLHIEIVDHAIFVSKLPGIYITHVLCSHDGT